MTTQDVQSRTEVFDCVIPDEWSLYGAYILAPDESKFIDSKNHNLHVSRLLNSYEYRILSQEIKQTSVLSS